MPRLATAARIARTVRSSGSRDERQELSDGQTPLLSVMDKDPFEGRARMRVIREPQRALENLEPYARLHLDAIAGRHLLARDIDGRSDPFVEVYVNDVRQGVGPKRMFTLSPVWDYHVALDIYSPLSIVRLLVMDHDSLTKNDVIGFVEFCVADLEPGQEVCGWFELRRKRHLHGVAPKRLRSHMQGRDDDPFRKHRISHPPSHSGGTPRHLLPCISGPLPHSASGQHTPRADDGSPASPSAPLRASSDGGLAKIAEAAVRAASFADAETRSTSDAGRGADAGARAPTSRLARCRTVMALCQGKIAKAAASNGEDSSTDNGSEKHHRIESLLSRMAAAGHDAAEASANLVQRHRRSLETFFDMAKSIVNGEEDRPNAGEVHLRMRLETRGDEDDEWYAFCFPRPTFHVFPGRILSLEELYRDMFEIKRMLVHTLQAFVCVSRYIATWQCKPLTALALLWWVCFCVSPTWVSPTLILWLAVFVRLLREEEWQEAVLVHERTAALNDVGFQAVAKLGSTVKMSRWLRRVVGSMGRAVSNEQSLHDFACLVFRDERPVMSFDNLVQKLAEQKWVFHPSGPRRCPKGHGLVFLGSVGHGRHFHCQNPAGCCSYSAGRPWTDVCRYHCAECNIHICEPCVAKISRPPLWTSLPNELIPDHLETVLVHMEEPLDHFRQIFDLVLQVVGLPFQQGAAGIQAARTVYKACALIMAVWYLLVYLATGPLEGFTSVLCRMLLFVLGCCGLFVDLPLTRRALVCIRASADFEKYRRRRSAVPLLERWPFWVPDVYPATGASAKSLAGRQLQP